MAALALDEAQIRRLRLRANGLGPAKLPGSAADIVARVCGLQAQDRAAAELALQPRSNDLSLDAVRAGLDTERDLVRTWAMRGTIHLLAAQDVGWLLGLLGPVFVKKGARRRRQLGLDEPIYERAQAAMRRHLSDEGALTRHELAGRMAAEGIPVDGQAVYHLVYRAGLEGLICFGADRDGEHTFVLLQEWLGLDGLDVDETEALGRLGHRYLRAFGPGNAQDLAKWCGLGVRQAHRALQANAEALLQVEAAGEKLFLLQEQVARLEEPEGDEIVVRLLPAYDSFLLGYSSREGVVPEAFARRVHPGGGVIQPTVLIDGMAAGRWRLRRKHHLQIEPFRTLSAAEQSAVAREVQEMERYLGRPAR